MSGWDISVKTRSALLTKRQNGDYVGSCPIYGYRKDPENKNHLLIDEDVLRWLMDDVFQLVVMGFLPALQQNAGIGFLLQNPNHRTIC